MVSLRRVIRLALLGLLLHTLSLFGTDFYGRLHEHWERQTDCLAYREGGHLLPPDCVEVLSHHLLHHGWHSPPSLMAAVNGTLAWGDPVLLILLFAYLDLIFWLVSCLRWERRLWRERALLASRPTTPHSVTLPEEKRVHQSL